MAPSGEECTALDFALSPPESSGLVFKKLSYIHREDVIETPVFSMTAGNNKKLISDSDRRMESSSTGFGAVLLKSNFLPRQGLKVKGPDIVHIGDTFTSENDKVRVEKFSSVVGSLPGCLFIFFWNDFSPLLGGPVEQVYRVESLFVRGASTIDYDSVVLFIVAH